MLDTGQGTLDKRTAGQGTKDTGQKTNYELRVTKYNEENLYNNTCHTSHWFHGV